MTAEAVGRGQPEDSNPPRFRATSERGRRLAHHRQAILALMHAHGISNVRVVGSVAIGTDRDGSDIDLLVDLPADIGLFSLARLENELEALLGVKVDVIPARSLRPQFAERMLSEAVPL